MEAIMHGTLVVIAILSLAHFHTRGKKPARARLYNDRPNRRPSA